MTSLASLTFPYVVAKRQKLVIAARAYDAISDTCECETKKCPCTVAWYAYQDAARERNDAEASWREAGEIDAGR